MKALAAAVLLAAIATPGCGDNGDPERLPELEAEVRAATRALLDAPGFTGVAVRSGEARTVTRVDWVDYRADGDYRYVAVGITGPGEDAALFGLVQVGAELFSAQRGGDGDQPWARLDEQPTERIPLSLNLAEIAAGDLSPVADVEGGGELVREASATGEVRWVMDSPHRGDRLVQTWVIGADGMLRTYVIRTEGGAVIQDGTTAIDYGFTPVPEPGPLTPPLLGAPLDLAELGVPADLPLAGG